VLPLTAESQNLSGSSLSTRRRSWAAPCVKQTGSRNRTDLVSVREMIPFVDLIILYDILMRWQLKIAAPRDFPAVTQDRRSHRDGRDALAQNPERTSWTWEKSCRSGASPFGSVGLYRKRGNQLQASHQIEIFRSLQCGLNPRTPEVRDGQFRIVCGPVLTESLSGSLALVLQPESNGD
jgi:hypothetical protein